MEQREIKFKAWVEEQNRMIDVYGFNKDHVFQDTLDGACMGNNIFPAHTCKLLQFTGLHDKNGKEIYEGDVIQSPNTTKWIVKWTNDYACFFAVSGSVLMSPIDNVNCEVIGNIYENPELTQPSN